MIVEFLTETFVNIIEYLGYWGVFILMTLESMIAPVPSEAVMPFAGFLVAEGKISFLLVILVSSAASLFGSLLSYYIGLYGGRPLALRFGKYLLISKHDLDISDRWFAKHGDATIFVCRFIPVVRHLISIPAGVAKMNIWKFSLYTVIGATMWNTFLLYLGMKLQENWEIVHDYSSYLDIIVVVGILVVGVWYVKRHLRK